MAYSELIKDFARIRSYLRSFYAEGFRHRGDFTQKSARGYDNEKRRIESWLGDYVSFRQDEDGRRAFLSVDSRAMPTNPLYQAFRAKSFTDLDITLHFHLLDILRTDGDLPILGIMDRLADRLFEFESDVLPDESTVRKKLKEYVNLGIVRTYRRGKGTFYALCEDHVDLDSWDAAVAFFCEAAPLGVIGSFVQDRLPRKFAWFRFKHHYILNALDSEILYNLLLAIEQSRTVSLVMRNRTATVLPLKVYAGTQTDRQHVLAWSPFKDRFRFFRLDLIERVRMLDAYECPEDLRKRTADFCSHVWGVAGSDHARLVHIQMTVFVGPNEDFVVERLEREKRCGMVEQLDQDHWRFSADVHDALEMLPWLRTFTGRVTDLQCSDTRVVTRFWEDFEELARRYGAEGAGAGGNGARRDGAKCDGAGNDGGERGGERDAVS